MPQYAIGIDFGTESARALLVDVADGRELATAMHLYANGVIDDYLPESKVRLEPDWALQDPNDYLAALQQTVPALLRQSGVTPSQVIGLGIDFTSCTMLPVRSDGTPLCNLPEFRHEPHAWVKLWKHHAAQPEADLINQVAAERGEPWLRYYGGRISSEWFISKSLQILNEAPHIYQAAERLIEAGDWLVWQLIGRESRSTCMAGYKAMWQKDMGFPSRDYFAALHPDFGDLIGQKMRRQLDALGARAGELSQQAAAWSGLHPGTAVGVAMVDAYSAVPAGQATQPGDMLMILGTSTCHMVVSRERSAVPGMCGVVEDGFLPGLFCYEAGQSATGDIFAWLVKQGVAPIYHEEAQRRGQSIWAYLEAEAARQRPGEHGLLALDWWNGCRSTLMDAELSGLIVGMTLSTTAADIFRALIEATAFGTRHIIETLVAGGVPVQRIIAAGGMAEQNKLLMQIYADVTNRELRVVKSAQAAALGAAMLGAVAAGPALGGHADLYVAASQMGGLKEERYRPMAKHVRIYDQLYADYQQLYDSFGRDPHGVMKRLRALRRGVWTVDSGTVGR
jgi:L-ribulokinase